MTEDRSPTRLPPPAFPPGSRHRPLSSTDPEATPPKPDGGVIGPDQAGKDEAFTLIAPDDPFPDRDGLERGTATGIGDDPHLAPEEVVAGGDPYVIDLTAAVSKLAEALRRRGEAGLHATPEMSRFEATLRAYCVGYLAGRRAESNGSEG